MRGKRQYLVILSVIFAASLLYLFLRDTKENTGKITLDGSERVIDHTNHQFNTENRFKLERNRLKKYLKKEKIRPLLTERDKQLNEFLETSGFTWEEWREISQILKESQPYYWDMAAVTLEKMHHAQAPDLEWTDSIEDEARKTMELEEAAGTELEEVDCRQSLCRIGYFHKDGDAFDRYYNGPMDEGSWISGASNSFGGTEILEDGTVESFLYFTKKDQGETFIELRKKIIDEMRGQQVADKS